MNWRIPKTTPIRDGYIVKYEEANWKEALIYESIALIAPIWVGLYAIYLLSKIALQRLKEAAWGRLNGGGLQ